MNKPAIIFLLGVLLVAVSGCSSLPAESSLRAQVRYIPDGKEVKIVSATTNFETYRESFLIGFAQGYSDGMNEGLTIVEFKKSARKSEYFHWVGTKFGMRVAREVLKGPPNQAPLPTSMSVTDRAGARSAPATLAADL